LSEFIPLKGKILLSGDLSYASQEPWLFRGSIKSNIIFGQPFNMTRYKQVTKACALSEDFEQLSNGDMTFLGENGVTLSGGQSARVNLAR
jgi:ATP-binding cassette subfamily C (CFTR/MRP) protein 4